MSEQSSAPAKTKDEAALATTREQAPRRREPGSLLEEMQTDLARLFELGAFGMFPFARSLRRVPQLATAGMPRVDVFEREGDLVVKAEVPGVKKEDIDLEVTDGDLVLRAERKEEHEVTDENWYRKERSYGSFYRRLPLPEGVQADQIKAELADGVLEVTIPKPQGAASRAQKIAIA
jgi:HSP20 family protein